MDDKIDIEYLISLIQEQDLDSEQIQVLTERVIGVWMDEIPPAKDELITILRDYWNEWGDNPERPLFI